MDCFYIITGIIHAVVDFHLIAEDMRCKSIIKTFKIASSVPNIINLAGFGLFFTLCDKTLALIEYQNDKSIAIGCNVNQK